MKKLTLTKSMALPAFTFLATSAIVLLSVINAENNDTRFAVESEVPVSHQGIQFGSDQDASGGQFIEFTGGPAWTPMDQIDITKSYDGTSIIGPGQAGSVRVTCLTSHFSYDDPIVFPGQQNRAHLHMFWGNSITNANSTINSLLNTGHGTCQGNEINRTGYWVPALIDRDNNARIPRYFEIYYKRGAVHAPIEVMPNGLTMIVGKASANTVSENINDPNKSSWGCGIPPLPPRDSFGSLIPSCGAGRGLALKLQYPQCWNGRDLSAPDYISHMAYPAGGFCPSSHPVKIPEITYNVYWDNFDQNTGGWHLSSDIRTDRILPGGTTTHGDWMGAWNPEILEIMKNGCFNQGHDCKGGTIAPGKRLVGTMAPNVLGGGKIPVSSIPGAQLNTHAELDAVQ